MPDTRNTYEHPFISSIEETVVACSDLELVDDPAQLLEVTDIRIEMPFEMATRVERDGTCLLAGSPPTERITTSFSPIYHRITLKLEKEDGE